MRSDQPVRRRSVAAFLTLLSLLLFAGATLAQDHPGAASPAVGVWDVNAAQARNALEEARRGRVDLPTLRQVRAALVSDREESLAYVNEGNLDARILEAQVKALGQPVDGDEGGDSRRSTLVARLEVASAPIAAARDANARAGVLIQEIDRVIDHAGRAQLLRRQTSPLMPDLWRRVAQETATIAEMLRQASQSQSPTGRQALIQAMPFAVVLGGMALVLGFGITRSCRRFLLRRVDLARTDRARLAYAFAQELLSIMLPALAVMSAAAAVTLLGRSAPAFFSLASVLLASGLVVVFARWLGHAMFKPTVEAARIMVLAPDEATRAVRYTRRLGLVLGGDVVVGYLQRSTTIGAAIVEVLSLCLVCAGAYQLWRLAGIVRRQQRTSPPEDMNALGLQRPAAYILTMAAIAAPLAVLTGYVALAREVLTSSLLSVGAVAAAVFCYRAVMAAVGMLGARDREDHGGIHLLPLVFGFALGVLVVAFVAIVWGMRPERILDLVILLKDGIPVGDTRISLSGVVTFAIVFSLGFIATHWFQRLSQQAILPRIGIEAAARSAVSTGVGYIGLTVSALIAVVAAGLDLSSLAVVAGALSVGIGFGLQPIVANFISGLILLMERPIREGDWIEGDGYSGQVRRISIRSTYIETWDRNEVIVPNSALAGGRVTNMTFGSGLTRITAGVLVGPNSNFSRVREILRASAIAHPDVVGDPAPYVALEAMSSDALTLNLFFFVRDARLGSGVRSDVLFDAIEQLAAEGVPMPFAAFARGRPPIQA